MCEHLFQQLFTCHVNTCLSSCSHGLFDCLNTCFDPFRIKIGVPDMKVTQKSVHNLCFEPIMNDFLDDTDDHIWLKTQSVPKMLTKGCLAM